MMRPWLLVGVSTAVLVSSVLARAASTSVQWGANRGVTPWNICIYDSANVCQTVFTLAPSGGGVTFPALSYLTLAPAYSAAGTPLPTCNAGLKGTLTTVSDAIMPTPHAAYVSGGAVTGPVFCDGVVWETVD